MKKRKSIDVDYNMTSDDSSKTITSEEPALELNYDNTQTIEYTSNKPDSKKKKLAKKAVPFIYRNVSSLGLDPIAGAVEVIDSVLGETGAMLVVGEVKERIENRFDIDIDSNRKKKERKKAKKLNKK